MTLGVARFSKPARQTVSGYLPRFFRSSGPPRTRTPISWVQTKCLPLGPAALHTRGPFGNRTRSSSLPRRCAAGTPTDQSVIPDGIEPSLSWLSPRRLCLWTTGSQVTEAGIEPAITRLSTSSLCQFAYPVASGGSGCCTGHRRAAVVIQAYEAWLGTGPPAVAGPGIEPGAPALWEPVGHLPRLQSKCDLGEIRTPMPCGTTL